MINRKTLPIVFMLITAFASSITVIAFAIRSQRTHPPHVVSLPAAPVPDPRPDKKYTAALEVARIFGRSTNGCAEADPKLITTVAEESIASNVDPRVLAALIAIESGCNQFASSTKGAFGLTQVVAKVWKEKYNFETDYNLFNERQNIHVGADILGGLVKQYGLQTALRRYSGLGTDCDSCDAGYPDRVQALAAKR